MNNQNTSVYNDSPIFGEVAHTPFFPPVKQFRVMTPPRAYDFSYSTYRGFSRMDSLKSRSIDAIRARRARLEALTAKSKLPPIATTGAMFSSFSSPGSLESARTLSSGDSQRRGRSASMRPPSIKSQTAASSLAYTEAFDLPALSLNPIAPYHNPLPDISREKVQEEDESTPDTGLDSPPPPTLESTVKVSKWVEQLPDADENMDLGIDDVNGLEDQNPVLDSYSLNKSTTEDSDETSVPELSDNKEKNDVAKETNSDDDSEVFEGFQDLFTVVLEVESMGEEKQQQELTKELPIEDMEVGGDMKEELEREYQEWINNEREYEEMYIQEVLEVQNLEHSLENTVSPLEMEQIENAVSSLKMEQNHSGDEIRWTSADSIFSRSPVSNKSNKSTSDNSLEEPRSNKDTSDSISEEADNESEDLSLVVKVLNKEERLLENIDDPVGISDNDKENPKIEEPKILLNNNDESQRKMESPELDNVGFQSDLEKLPGWLTNENATNNTTHHLQVSPSEDATSLTSEIEEEILSETESDLDVEIEPLLSNL